MIVETSDTSIATVSSSGRRVSSVLPYRFPTSNSIIELAEQMSVPSAINHGHATDPCLQDKISFLHQFGHMDPTELARRCRQRRIPYKQSLDSWLTRKDSARHATFRQLAVDFPWKLAGDRRV